MDVQGAFRAANDRIAEQATALAFEGPIPLLCECEDRTCFAIVRLDARDYTASRAAGTPIALPDHLVGPPAVVDSPP